MFSNMLLVYISLSTLPEPPPLRTPYLRPLFIFPPCCWSSQSLPWHTLFFYPPHLICVGMEDVWL